MELKRLIIFGWLTLSALLWSVLYLLYRISGQQQKVVQKLRQKPDSFQIQGYCMECSEPLIVLELHVDQKLDRTVIGCPSCQIMAINIAEFQHSSG